MLSATMRGLGVSIVIGGLLRFVVGLQPIAWLAWLVPALLLAAAFSTADQRWRWQVLVAGLIGYQANAAYYFSAMPVVAGTVVILGQALLWMLVVGESRRVVRRWRHGWTALAFPVFWVAVDTLQARWLPDGNWGSLAYSQGDVLPVLQVASLFGIAGVLFVLCLWPSALAVLYATGWRERSARVALAVAITVVTAAFGFGTWRLRETATGTPLPIGLVAVDDAIGLKARSPYVQGIAEAYDTHVAALAHAGARVVVLPEKIAVASEADAVAWRSRFAATAARDHVWLLAGLGVATARGIVNDAWLLTPDGRVATTYRKQKLAPPERGDYVAGDTCVVHGLDGVTTGLAICKDMHFATLGRDYGALDAGLMLVPAWDFERDGWLAARMTAVRGIENGYAVARSAREGRLTLTDAYGRVVAETTSRALPGERLVATLPVGARVSTLYTRIGNSVGWLCVAVAAGLAVASRRTRTTA